MAIDSAANHMVGAEATSAGFVISTLTGGEDFALQIGSLTERSPLSLRRATSAWPFFSTTDNDLPGFAVRAVARGGDCNHRGGGRA